MTPKETAAILGQPLKVGALTLSNRMIMGPMAAHGAEKDGSAGDQTVAFFERRARGGVGMIIIGGMTGSKRTDTEFPGVSGGLRVDDDCFILGLKRLADACHAHGVPVIAEIMPSAGRMAQKDPMSASPKNTVIQRSRMPRGMSAPKDVTTTVPREATVAEIRQLEQDMIDAAGRAWLAGLDGVEIPAIMNYFMASFLTPRTNWRTDEYGGPPENRARMLVNIVSGIRARTGSDFVIGLRTTSNEYLPDGQGAQGYAEIAKLVEAAGADYVALSPGCYESQDVNLSVTDGQMVESGDTRAFKNVLSIPLFFQGIHDPARAASEIAKGEGEAIMLARSLLADPDYPRKVLEGQSERIVACKRDNYCIRRMVLGMDVRCEVNPEMGREGKIPTLASRIKAPFEEVALAAISSKRLMGLVGAVLPKGRG